jgi:hypothetical protein
MVGRVMPCIGADGEFASDMKSRAAAVEWLAHLIAEGKHWSEARSEIVEFYSLAGMDYQQAHARSKSAKPFLKPWLEPTSRNVRATVGPAQALSL